MEHHLRLLLAQEIPSFALTLKQRLRMRSRRIVQQITPFLPELHSIVIDWGCGDGEVAASLSGGYDVITVDVHDHRSPENSLPFLLYDEQQGLQGMTGKAEVVLLLTVLHHARAPMQTITDVLRLEPQRVIVIESVPDHPEEFFAGCNDPALPFRYCAFVDWFYNRIICQDVQMTYQYRHTGEWINSFRSRGYRVVATEVLGIDQPIVPEWHVLLVFDRDNAYRSPPSEANVAPPGEHCI